MIDMIHATSLEGRHSCARIGPKRRSIRFYLKIILKCISVLIIKNNSLRGAASAIMS
jgi:hypothetical protein